MPLSGSARRSSTGSNFDGDPVTIPSATAMPRRSSSSRTGARTAKRRSHGWPSGWDRTSLPSGVDRRDRVDAGRCAGRQLPAVGVARGARASTTIPIDRRRCRQHRVLGVRRRRTALRRVSRRTNNVVLRTAGEYGDDAEVYTELFEKLAAGEQISDPRRLAVASVPPSPRSCA